MRKLSRTGSVENRFLYYQSKHEMTGKRNTLIQVPDVHLSD